MMHKRIRLGLKAINQVKSELQTNNNMDGWIRLINLYESVLDDVKAAYGERKSDKQIADRASDLDRSE